MNCKDTTKIQIVMWMLGSPGMCKWRLLCQLLDHYSVEYSGYTAEGTWVADPTMDREDLETEWKLALIETLDHFAKETERAKFFAGRKITYGFFLTKAVWSMTVRLERAGAIPVRKHKKVERDENGRKLKNEHHPARHGRCTTILLSGYVHRSCGPTRGVRAWANSALDIAILPEYDDGEHHGY